MPDENGPDELEEMMSRAVELFKSGNDPTFELQKRWPGIDWFPLVRERAERSQ